MYFLNVRLQGIDLKLPVIIMLYTFKSIQEKYQKRKVLVLQQNVMHVKTFMVQGESANFNATGLA